MFQAENVLRLTCYFRHIANDDFSYHPVINTAFSEVLRELQKRRFNLPNEVGVKKRVKRARGGEGAARGGRAHLSKSQSGQNLAAPVPLGVGPNKVEAKKSPDTPAKPMWMRTSSHLVLSGPTGTWREREGE